MVRETVLSSRLRSFHLVGGRLARKILVPMLFFTALGAMGNSGPMASPPTSYETISGHYAGQGVTCARFRLESGEVISISGVYPEMVPDQLFVLHGRWAEVSKCMQGREFRVLNIGE